MYVPRVEPYDFERPAIVLRVLDALEQAYLASVHENMDATTQHQRLEAWCADAETATARIPNGPFADEIAANDRRARGYRAET